MSKGPSFLGKNFSPLIKHPNVFSPSVVNGGNSRSESGVGANIESQLTKATVIHRAKSIFVLFMISPLK
jgi:hypothetical protein